MCWGEKCEVGEDLLWPLTKDEPTLKLDSSHYLFSIRPPPAVAAEADEANANGMNAASTEILNYGVTFASEEGLELVDKYLPQHACFFISTSESACCRPKLTMARPKHGADPEESSEAYWSTFEPKAKEYNSKLAKVQKGGEFVRGRVKANANKTSDISPRTKENTRRILNCSLVKELSRMTEIMSENVVAGVFTGGVFTASRAVTGSVASSKAGQNFFTMPPGEVVLASLDAFMKDTILILDIKLLLLTDNVLQAAGVAGKEALSTTSEVTTEIVAHSFGEDAAEVTKDSLAIAGNAIGIAWNIFKFRKAINLSKKGAR
eukprot:Gb_39731 [translate_table: standard]